MKVDEWSDLKLLRRLDRLMEECNRRNITWSEGGYLIRNAWVIATQDGAALALPVTIPDRRDT